MNYREMYANVIEQLGDTYGTPAYAQALENYYKLFEKFAVENVYWIIEDERMQMHDLYMDITEEMLNSYARELEILHRVNYSRVDEWEEDYEIFKARLAKKLV